MANTADDNNKESQIKRFADAASDLGCDEDEADFGVALGKIARQNPPADPPKEQKQPKTKKPD